MGHQGTKALVTVFYTMETSVATCKQRSLRRELINSIANIIETEMAP